MGSPFAKSLRRLFRAGPKTSPASRKLRRTLNVERLEARDNPGVFRPLTSQLPSISGGAEMMVPLSDGTVLIQGGSDASTKVWFKLTPDATGSYINGTITQVASMNLQRLFYASNILPNGKLFVLGGEYSGPAGNQNFINTGEIYDPVANTWTSIAAFPQSNFGDDPTAVLPDGTILAGFLSGPQTYIYNPTTNTWKASGTRLRFEQSDEEQFVALPNGSGFLSYDVFASAATGNSTAQKYSTATGAWSDAGAVPVLLTSDAVNDELGPAFLLPDGRVFQIGANNNTAIYTPSTNSWVAGPTTPNNRGADDAPGAVLPNGHVLYAADDWTNFGFNPPTQLFDFDPIANKTTQLTSSNTTFPSSLTTALNNNGSFVFRMLNLPNGDVLLCDGNRQIWEYTPDGSPNAAWRPTITSITSNGGQTYTITGTQLNGMSEGAAYGDDAEMSTNFPIVRLTGSTGNVYYARTFNWSNTGVQTGSAQVSTQFTVPANLPTDSYTITVSASGIASIPINFAQQVYVDTHWAGLPDGTAITDVDPVTAGNQPGTIGSNAFASVNAAIAIEPLGGRVVVNGDDGSGQFGKFNESVVINKLVTVFVQQGPVTFGSLSGTAANGSVSSGFAVTVGGDNTDTEFDGVFSGTGSLTKTGTGAMTLAGANTYTGGTTVSGGTLQIGNGGTTGSLTGSIVNNSTLAFDRSDNATFAGTISGSGNTVNLGNEKITGTISGGQSVTQNSTGTLTLTSFNLFTGGVTVAAGTLKLGNARGLGALNDAVTVNAGGTLNLNGVSPTIGTLTVNGAITNTAGGSPVVSLLGTSQYDLQMSGTATVAAGVTFGLTASGTGGVQLNAGAQPVNLTGVTFDLGGTAHEINVAAGGQWNLVDSPIVNGGFTLTGGGTLSIQGTTAVTNTSPITIASGTLDLDKTAGVTAVAGDVTLAGGTLHLTTSNQIADTSTITVTSGTFDLGGQSETIGTLTGAGGQVSLANGAALTVDEAAITTYGGTITGSGAFTMAGTGTLSLSGAETYTGPTTVSSGILLVNGSLAAGGMVTVAAGATLGGSGSVGSTTVSGMLSPGNGIGVLTTNALAFGAGGSLTTPLNGNVPGTNYSQVVATGPVNLTGATLVVPVANGFTPPLGTTFDILVNNSGSAVTGTFAGLSEGANFTAGGQNFSITYHGGASGHDVVLTRADATPPTVATVQVNDGTAQRSEVRSLIVTFSGPVTFTGGDANAAAAFQLNHVQDGNNVALSAAVSTDAQGRTTVTLSFSGAETDPVSALNGGAASLADGRYSLTILGANVTGANGVSLDGAGNGTAGSNYVSAADAFQGSGPHLYRLFGDVNGDGVVDATDLGQLRSTFNSSSGSPLYLAYLDADNSGAVDAQDLGQFRGRFNTNVF